MSNVSSQKIQPGDMEKAVSDKLKTLDEMHIAKRLFEKDATLWKTDPEQMKAIGNRLGWLTLPGNADDLIAFATQIKSEGYRHAVLLGMGGSSLCSEVAVETFGSAAGYPELIVLDNTSPDAIHSIEQRIDIEKTLFIAASKSGNTMETLSFYKYFYERLQAKGFAKPGNNFVAITDAGSPLVTQAEQHGFRRVFINPSDIGGRYSVLSDFGLVPMALMGIDIKALLSSAAGIKESAIPEIKIADNPAIDLGVVIGTAQQHGRDKITFIMSSSIQAFGYWVEQLIAESTGKEGKGLIPVTGETLGDPEVYQNDRIFVHLYLSADDNTYNDSKLAALAQAGHTVVSIEIKEKIDIGGEFYRWEIATAIAGIVIGINPFDEPNVAEGKKNTNDILDKWRQDKSFVLNNPLTDEGDIQVYSGAKTGLPQSKNKPLKDLLVDFVSLAKPDDYIAILAYFEETKERTDMLQAWRMKIRDTMKTATTLAYGPRYLHSTGQLHKGGPASGLYIILAGDDKEDIAIPEQEFSFGVLHKAQSLGDFKSLDTKDRRVIYITLDKNIEDELKKICL